MRISRLHRTRLLWSSLLALCALLPLDGSNRARAQFFPEEEPLHEHTTFGCNPGPVEPFVHADPPIPPHYDRREDAPPHPVELSVANAVDGRLIEGAGFNLEHTLWSCRTFRRMMDNWILEAFEPDVARVDSGQLPFAPEYVPAEQLGWSVYQSMMDDPKYQPSWEMLRRLNRSNVKIMLGIWGGPGQFNDNGTRRGALLREHIDDYVLYTEAMVDYLIHRQGVQIWAVTVMNEPDGGDGTYIDPDDFLTVAQRMGPRLAAYGVQLYGPDTASAGNAIPYLQRMLENRETLSYFAAIATHEYFAQHAVADVAAMLDRAGVNLPIYITEYTSFVHGAMDRGQEANDELGHMLDSLLTYVSVMNSGADAALYWDAVDYFQAGHAAITRWGLLQGPEESFAPRKRFFGFQQILPYAQAGSRVLRTDMWGSADVAALALNSGGSRSGDLMVAIVNTEGPLDMTVYFDADPPRTMDVYVTDHDLNYERTGRLTTHGRQANVFVPARSITTLTTGPAPLDD